MEIWISSYRDIKSHGSYNFFSWLLYDVFCIPRKNHLFLKFKKTFKNYLKNHLKSSFPNSGFCLFGKKDPGKRHLSQSPFGKKSFGNLDLGNWPRTVFNNITLIEITYPNFIWFRFSDNKMEYYVQKEVKFFNVIIS